MRGRALFCLIGSLILIAKTAGAVDRGQFEDVPGHIRTWFKSVRSPTGAPCCDIADAIEQSTTSVPAPIGCLSMASGGRCRTTPSFEMPAIRSVKPSSGMSVFAAISPFAVSFPLTRARTQAGTDELL